jgi:hypothetical protein
MDCHSVSNDAGPCQGLFGNTSPMALVVLFLRHFVSEKGFDLADQGSWF